ncbi:hypothetical protein D3C76_548690 [compost metagenome]
MPEAVVWVIGVLVVALLAYLLRYAAKRYMGTKVATIMLAVEKELATWATEQNTGARKHAAALYLINLVYPALPAWVKVFVSQDKAIEYIEVLYSQALELLADDRISGVTFKAEEPKQEELKFL